MFQNKINAVLSKVYSPSSYKNNFILYKEEYIIAVLVFYTYFEKNIH